MFVSRAVLKIRALTILWPAFLMAGVLEMLVFAVVDPGDLRWFGVEALNWSSQAIYTVTFLIFWAVIATAGALTALLEASPEEINADRGRTWPR
jgi:hypothetical protein